LLLNSHPKGQYIKYVQYVRSGITSLEVKVHLYTSLTVTQKRGVEPLALASVKLNIQCGVQYFFFIPYWFYRNGPQRSNNA
jgi:hypothetical protein